MRIPIFWTNHIVVEIALDQMLIGIDAGMNSSIHLNKYKFVFAIHVPLFIISFWSVK